MGVFWSVMLKYCDGSVILNMGVYTIKFCSEVNDERCKTLQGSHATPFECKCISDDTCYHEPKKGATVDYNKPIPCTRTITVVDR
eukprot:gene28991-9625_t